MIEEISALVKSHESSCLPVEHCPLHIAPNWRAFPKEMNAKKTINRKKEVNPWVNQTPETEFRCVW